MLQIPPDQIGRDVDLGETTVTADLVHRYAETVGDLGTLEELRRGRLVAAPPTFALALHRGMRPEVALPPDHFGVYGGHDIELVGPIRIGRTYRLTARLTGAFEKSGRSGTLTVVEREAVIGEPGGEVATRLRERQIVRPRPAGAPTVGRAVPGPPDHDDVDAPPHPGGPGAARPTVETPGLSPERRRQLALGDALGPLSRPGTPTEQVGRYVAGNDMREGLFTDADVARRLGYRGIVVPGPMLTAFVEHFLRTELQGWRLEHLGTTFRIPTISGDPITLRGVVSEEDGEHIVCDVVIEHAGGERAVTAVARLRRATEC